MSEVAILTCARTENKLPFVTRCLNLPLSSLLSTSSRYVADTAFSLDGSQIAIVTDQGYWTVYDFSIRDETTSTISSGHVGLPWLFAERQQARWWKILWMDSPGKILLAENKGLYLLNVKV
jgi:hypothetical protein